LQVPCSPRNAGITWLAISQNNHATSPTFGSIKHSSSRPHSGLLSTKDSSSDHARPDRYIRQAPCPRSSLLLPSPFPFETPLQETSNQGERRISNSRQGRFCFPGFEPPKTQARRATLPAEQISTPSGALNRSSPPAISVWTARGGLSARRLQRRRVRRKKFCRARGKRGQRIRLIRTHTRARGQPLRLPQSRGL
jgi:hypothetical protein